MDVDLVVRNASVVTMDDERPRARSLAVHHGRVLALDAEGLRGRTEIDAQGAALVPGFGDAHNHMAWFGQGLDAARPVRTHRPRHALRARRRPAPRHWTRARWSSARATTTPRLGGHPHRRELDRAAGGRPVWLQHRSGHVCTVNGPLLERIGAAGRARRRCRPAGWSSPTGPASPPGCSRSRRRTWSCDLVVPYPVDELARAIGRASAVYAAEGLTHVTECGIGGRLGRPVAARAGRLPAGPRGR